MENSIIFFETVPYGANVAEQDLKRYLNPKDEQCISKIEQPTAIFVGQDKIIVHDPKICKSQYLVESCRYRPHLLHAVIAFRF